MKWHAPVVLLLCSLTAPMALAFDSDSALQNLKSLSQPNEQAAAPSALVPDLRMESRLFSNYYGSLESYLQNNNYEQALRTIKAWLASTKNAEVRQSLEKLLKDLQQQQLKNAERLSDQLTKLEQSIAAALPKIKTADGVWPFLDQFEEFRDAELSSGDRALRRLANRVSRDMDALNAWQRLLIEEENGNMHQAMSQLESLKRNVNPQGVVSRELMAQKTAELFERRMSQVSQSELDSPLHKELNRLMAQLKSPADAPSLLIALQELQSFNHGSDGRLINAMQNGLNELVRMQQSFDEGAYARVLNASLFNSVTPYQPQINELANRLRAQAAAAANDLSELGMPKPGEGFGTFIRRSAFEAFEKKDWPRLFALLAIYGNVTGGGCSRTSSMQEGVRCFLAARQLEEAGLHRSAVQNYTLCIAQLGPLVPREEAKAALDRIKKSHPEAFAPATPSVLPETGS